MKDKSKKIYIIIMVCVLLGVIFISVTPREDTVLTEPGELAGEDVLDEEIIGTDEDIKEIDEDIKEIDEDIKGVEISDDYLNTIPNELVISENIELNDTMILLLEESMDRFMVGHNGVYFRIIPKNVVKVKMGSNNDIHAVMRFQIFDDIGSPSYDTQEQVIFKTNGNRISLHDDKIVRSQLAQIVLDSRETNLNLLEEVTIDGEHNTLVNFKDELGNIVHQYKIAYDEGNPIITITDVN